VNTFEYIDSGVDWATMYYYALRTTDINDNSVWSNEDSVATPGLMPDSVAVTVTVGDGPEALCSLPSGAYVYVANYNSDDVSVINTLDNVVTATVNVGDRPKGICSLPSGEYMYVANYSDDNVSVIVQ
jgi:YVTN family beta-propeller protein